MSHRTPHLPRQPLTVRGGIRAQSRRGGFARQWWGRRWLAMLEGLQLGARLGRGRSYAFAGQVASLDISPGLVTASVQGASAAAYQAEIRCATLAAAPRAALVARLRARPLLLARLLVRELPREIEALFQEAGLPLFPATRADLASHCSCPDRANTCKHLAAVHFLLTEAFDAEPLLLLALRGIAREELLQPLGSQEETLNAQRSTLNAQCCPQLSVESWALSVERSTPSFWGVAAEGKPADFGPAPAEGVAAPLARRLGPLPFWRGEERFLDSVALASGRAVSAGWRVWAGECAPRRLTPTATSPAPRLRHQRPRMDTMR